MFCKKSIFNTVQRDTLVIYIVITFAQASAISFSGFIPKYLKVFRSAKFNLSIIDPIEYITFFHTNTKLYYLIRLRNNKDVLKR